MNEKTGTCPLFPQMIGLVLCNRVVEGAVMTQKGASLQGQATRRLRLYHGSDMAIEHPDVSLNTGFADLGRGFYLTDDHDAACRRALTRARRTGTAAGVVSAFELDEAGVPWISIGSGEALTSVESPFGLRFDADAAGLAAWISYIKTCRSGKTGVAGLGEPAVVRAWIATEEVEMVCSGLTAAEDLVPYLDVSELLVQYCLRDQAFVDEHLSFVEAEIVPTD